jgi:hypothetical protein
VVDQLDVDHRGGFGHAAGEADVFGAGGGIAAGVGVEQDEAGGAAQQALLEDLARLDRGAVDGAAEDLLVGEEVATDVEEEGSHYLLVALLVAQAEVACDLDGAVEAMTVGNAVPGEAAGAPA